MERAADAARDASGWLIGHIIETDPGVRSEAVDQLKALALPAHGNPYDPDRRNALLESYRAGAITPEDAKELGGCLHEDMVEAERRGDPGTVALAMGLAIGLSAYVVGSAMVKQVEGTARRTQVLPPRD